MRERLPEGRIPDHVGLAYETWAPVGDDGKVPDGRRGGWLEALAGSRIAEDYRQGFDRWKRSLKAASDRVFELQLTSRLLVGHGNTSAVGIGLIVHRAWGVPVIPGSALKGLCAHYIEAVHGPSDPERAPWEQPENETGRAAYQGATWMGTRIRRGPGEVHRILFGAPDAGDDTLYAHHGLPCGAVQGEVAFHDALYIPGSFPGDRPFAADVLTVHQKGYYDSSGAQWPSDYDRLTPVAFLTVRPETRFLFALTGPADWTALAEHLLRAALERWGIGGKTSAGYGRLVSPDRVSNARPPSPAHRRGDEIRVVRIEDPKGKGKVKFEADDGFVGHFAGEPGPDVEIGESVKVYIANVSPHGYTLTQREPKKPKRGRR